MLTVSLPCNFPNPPPPSLSSFFDPPSSLRAHSRESHLPRFPPLLGAIHQNPALRSHEIARRRRVLEPEIEAPARPVFARRRFLHRPRDTCDPNDHHHPRPARAPAGRTARPGILQPEPTPGRTTGRRHLPRAYPTTLPPRLANATAAPPPAAAAALPNRAQSLAAACPSSSSSSSSSQGRQSVGASAFLRQ